MIESFQPAVRIAAILAALLNQRKSPVFQCLETGLESGDTGGGYIRFSFLAR